jgi:hypothetical protein
MKRTNLKWTHGTKHKVKKLLYRAEIHQALLSQFPILAVLFIWKLEVKYYDTSTG